MRRSLRVLAIVVLSSIAMFAQQKPGQATPAACSPKGQQLRSVKLCEATGQKAGCHRAVLRSWRATASSAPASRWQLRPDYAS